MGVFTPRISEIIISTFTLLAAWSIGFGACSIYFVRPAEIDDMVYLLLLLHIPTMVYFLLYVFRSVAIINAENRLKKVMIQGMVSGSEFKKGHIVGRAEVKRAADYHLSVLVLTCAMIVTSLGSMITRVIMYTVSNVDNSTEDAHRSSFLLIFVDIGVLVSASIIAIAIFFNGKKYHGQKLALIQAAALTNKSSLLNSDSSVPMSQAGARLRW